MGRGDAVDAVEDCVRVHMWAVGRWKGRRRGVKEGSGWGLARWGLQSSGRGRRRGCEGRACTRDCLWLRLDGVGDFVSRSQCWNMFRSGLMHTYCTSRRKHVCIHICSTQTYPCTHTRKHVCLCVLCLYHQKKTRRK